MKLMSELPFESGEPADEPIELAHDSREPVHEPRGPLPSVLTTADRVRAAHVAEPDATNGRIGELADVSLATVKRHRPSRVNGSPSGPLAAQTPINGEPLKVGR